MRESKKNKLKSSEKEDREGKMQMELHARQSRAIVVNVAKC